MNTLLAACAATLSLALATPVMAAAAPPATFAYSPERFSAEVIGHGPDVIMIPGLNTPRAVWQPQAERLKEHYRVHLIQLRGFGEPAGLNASGPVLDPFVADLARYLSENRIPRPAIIGHSLGGLAAMLLAVRHPDLSGRVMVVDALPFIGTLFDPAATATTIAPRAAQLKAALLAQAPGWQAPASAPDCADIRGEAPIAPGVMSRSMEGQCQIRGWTSASDPRVGAQAMEDDMVTDLREDIARITVPLSVVYARDARAMPAERFTAIWRTAYARAPAARLIPVDDSMHFVMLDQPETLDRTISAFLAEGGQ